MKGWQSIDYYDFIDVVPVFDLQDHFMGDECWCKPRVNRYPENPAVPIITHNSADKREQNEPDNKGECSGLSAISD